MKRFTELLKHVDQTTSTLKKVEHLKNYFLSVPAEDACWGLYLIAGEKIKAKVPRAFLHQAFIEFSGIPEWLFKAAVARGATHYRRDFDSSPSSPTSRRRSGER